MEEIFDIYDENGNYLGIKEKSFCHSGNPGCYHKTVWIWIINSKNQVLTQKRSKTKKLFPSKWDNSCAGHIRAGEAQLDACVREMSEELGITLSKDKFIFQGEVKLNSLWELAQFYVVREDYDISDFSFEDNEVEAVKWVSYDELVSLIWSDDFSAHEYAAKSYILEMVKKNLQK